MLIVGTVIGAGFASGREIVAYFGVAPSPLIAIIVAVFIFALCAVFLFIGSRLNMTSVSDVNGVVAGKAGGVIVSLALLLNSAVSLSAMLAGTDTLFCELLQIKPVYSIAAGLLSSIIVTVGIKGLKRTNAVLVPVLVLVVLFVTAFSIKEMHPLQLTADAISSGFVYATMNIFLAAGVLTTVSGLTKKQILLTSAFTALIVGGLVFTFALSLSSSDAGVADMPLELMAQRLGKPVYAVSVAAVAAGIFTTMLTAHQTLTDWLSSYLKSRLLSAIITLFACFLLSLIGFRRVVDLLYPLFGILGAVYFLVCFIWLLHASKTTEELFEHSNGKIHKRSEDAQHDRRGHHEVKLKHLPAVNNQIAESCSGNEIFAHNRAYPG